MKGSRVGFCLASFLLAICGLAGCSPCAGTPSCVTSADVSYTGQFIVRQGGKPVPGVRVEFVRQGAAEFVGGDTATAVSDQDGFFLFRAHALFEGYTIGRLRVTPPPPYQQYDVQDVVLKASAKRGDGGVLGRLVVDPFLQLLGELRDSGTGAPLANYRVIFRLRNNPRVIADDSVTFTTDGNGRFLWEPPLLRPEVISADIEISGPGLAPVLTHRDIMFQFVDGPPAFLQLRAP